MPTISRGINTVSITDGRQEETAKNTHPLPHSAQHSCVRSQTSSQTSKSSATVSNAVNNPAVEVANFTIVNSDAQADLANETSLEAWIRKPNSSRPYYKIGPVALYQGDAASVLGSMAGLSVDCIVTSPPYYGQRDYGVDGQIGLEDHPNEYIAKLVETFNHARLLMKPQGSLWVVIGDTYWSGKGRPRGEDPKRKYTRFDRPQDRTGRGDWCVPKQQLLIPHRFAIAMQNDGWIVRNDNVWYKPVVMPDPARDRCAISHEYVFHFVSQGEYYFNAEAIAVPSKSKAGKKTRPSVWSVPVEPSDKKHLAVFPPHLVRIPILATCPPGGIVLDPFCGSGTALIEAIQQNQARSAVGIDISKSALEEARSLLEAVLAAK